MFLDVRGCDLRAKRLVITQLARWKSKDLINEGTTRPTRKMHGVMVPAHAILGVERWYLLSGHRIVAAEVPKPDRRSAQVGGCHHAGELTQPLAEQWFQPEKPDNFGLPGMTR